MIPTGVQIFVALEPIDLRYYAEHIVMRSCASREAAQLEDSASMTLRRRLAYSA